MRGGDGFGDDGREMTDAFDVRMADLRVLMTSSRSSLLLKSSRTSGAPWTCCLRASVQVDDTGEEKSHLNSKSDDAEAPSFRRPDVVDVGQRYPKPDVRADDALAPEAQEAVRDDEGAPGRQVSNELAAWSDCYEIMNKLRKPLSARWTHQRGPRACRAARTRERTAPRASCRRRAPSAPRRRPHGSRNRARGSAGHHRTRGGPARGRRTSAGSRRRCG